MNLMAKNNKLLLPCLMTAYLFATGLGVATMSMSNDGIMSDCPFAGVDSICQMNTFEHIAAFQNLFRSIPQNTLLFLLSLFSFAMLLSVIQPLTTVPTRPRIFFTINISNIFFNGIIFAISNGVLQPKLYS